jgi:hypothetical protein
MLGFSMHWIYAHLIGDYLLQNDWMARNKKSNSIACLVHVLTYMIPFLFTDFNLLQLVLIALQHYIQDRTTLIAWFFKVTHKYQGMTGTDLFWANVITDNVVHILFMALIDYIL